jgi:2-keto-4-pentenoate hydratase/2-oxohepta-3-ene-1,7-dioic acid hydratase in catechol pathway
MKLATFVSGNQEPRVGGVADDKVHDLGSIADGMVAFLEGGRAALDQARLIVEKGSNVAGSLSDVTLKAPIPWPPKIIALAGNYQKHIVEGGGQEKDKATATPQLFMKPGTTVLDPGGTILHSRMTDQMDHEVELGVVIGKKAKYVSIEESLDHVAGYTVTIDVSSRRLIDMGDNRNLGPAEKFFDWLTGKWADTALPMGPWITTRDEIPDPQALNMKLSVNGTVKQDGSTSEMIHPVKYIVSFVSKFLTLQPGDIICTGTPHGVGSARGEFLKPGDEVVTSIESIGEIRNTVGPVT